MPKLKVKNLSNQEVGELDLNDKIFGAEVKEYLMHEIVRMQLNRRRSGTACTKERNAVAGGGAKPFRQKGTGRARQGTVTAPNHVGGGTVFGPRPRSYDFTPPKKVRGGAMCSALSWFVQEERITIVENFELAEAKTKGLADTLKTLGAEHALIVDSVENENLKRSARNLSEHQFLPVEGINVYDMLRHDQLILTKSAALKVQENLERQIGTRRAS